MSSIFRDFRFALRSFRRELRFCGVAIFALALGIAASTCVFSVFYNLLYNAFAARDPDRLAVPLGEGGEPFWPLAEVEAIREQNQVFEDIVAFDHRIALVGEGRENRQLYNTLVTANAFDFYGVPAFLGRGITSDDGKAGAQPVFVLSYETWSQEFGAAPGILGRHFSVNGEPRMLIGVMPPRFHAFGALQQMWEPFRATSKADVSDSSGSVYLLARLKRGVSLAAASADLDVIVQRLAKSHPAEFPKKFTARVESATDFLLGPYGIGGAGGSEYGFKSLLRNLLAAVAILLLIACGNVANLLLARATVREKEIAVRSALGATRGRLIRQLLVESSVLAVVAGVAGCVFAYFGVKGAALMIPRKGISIGGEVVIGLNPLVLLFALGATALTVFLCGLAPALRAVPGDLNWAMAGSGKGGSPSMQHGGFRSALVVGEVALSTVLLIGAGLLLRSFYVLTHVDIGFDPRHLLVAAFDSDSRSRTPEQNNALLQNLLQKVRGVPGVSDADVNYSLVGYNGGSGSEFTISGSTASAEGGIEKCGATLPRALGLRLLRGRWFSESHGEATPNAAVVNETLARKFFGDDDPLGQRLAVRPVRSGPSASTDSYEIIGVAADVKNWGGPKQPVKPMVYVPYKTADGFVIVIRTSVEPRSVMAAIQRQIWAVDSGMIFYQFEPMEDILDRLTYSAPKFGLAALLPVAGIAMLLVLIGIFSVMAYTVSLRTHEIGVRMALGAQRADILGMILERGMRLIAAGVIVGLFGSYALTRFLAAQIWGISPTDGWTFGGVVGLAVVAGMSACILPAFRATSIDPCEALRYE